MTPDNARIKLPDYHPVKADGTVNSSALERDLMVIERGINSLPFFPAFTFSDFREDDAITTGTPTEVQALVVEKQDSWTDLVIDARLSAYATTTGVRLSTFITHNEIDYLLASYFFNEANSHRHFTGIVRIANVPPGIVNLALSMAVSTSGVAANADDLWTIEVREDIPARSAT